MGNIKTSCFSIYKNKPEGVAISRGVPKWFKGDKLMELCPSWALIKNTKLSEQEWVEEYHKEVLCNLDPHGIAEKVEGKVLLCWEKPGEFCHRRVVAEWIEKETGIVVPEYEEKADQMKIF